MITKYLTKLNTYLTKFLWKKEQNERVQRLKNLTKKI